MNREGTMKTKLGNLVRKEKLVSRFVSGAALLLVLLAQTPRAVAADTAKTWYLRNESSVLTLRETAGSATAESATTMKDLSISSANTSFAVVGTWGLAGLLPNQAVSDLGSAVLWVGNTNGDQEGLNADVKVEVLKNSTVISTGDVACLAIHRVPSAAVTIDLPAPASAVHYDSGDTLALR